MGGSAPGSPLAGAAGGSMGDRDFDRRQIGGQETNAGAKKSRRSAWAKNATSETSEHRTESTRGGCSGALGSPPSMRVHRWPWIHGERWRAPIGLACDRDEVQLHVLWSN